MVTVVDPDFYIFNHSNVDPSNNIAFTIVKDSNGNMLNSGNR